MENGRPNLIDQPCIHCKAKPSRDWSDIVSGSVVCDQCALFKYEVDPEWDYPVMLQETQIEPGIWVRTCAMERMSKYGDCWYTFAVDVKTSRIKEVRRYRTKAGALAAHQECVNFVIVRREAMKRVRVP